MTKDLKDLPLNDRSEVTRHLEELFQNDIEIIKAVDELRLAINNQAEALAQSVYIIRAFVPEKLLAKASEEYLALRRNEIAAAASKNAN